MLPRGSQECHKTRWRWAENVGVLSPGWSRKIQTHRVGSMSVGNMWVVRNRARVGSSSVVGRRVAIS